ncbi:MAG TPA: hypothetical protein VGN55_09685 [Xanthobacteraceae bacterium]|jgi:hypothetical protein
MPSIVVSQGVFERLQRHAKPFVDSPETVITRALDALERPVGPLESAVDDRKGSPFPEFEALNPPNLTFTKVVTASLNGIAIKPSNWNRLLDAAVIHAAAQIGDFNKLQRVVAVNIATGVKTNEGYHHLPEAGISVQGQDANGAWRSAIFIAQNLKCTVEVSFIWRNKDGAEHPGKTGTMRFG